MRSSIYIRTLYVICTICVTWAQIPFQTHSSLTSFLRPCCCCRRHCRIFVGFFFFVSHLFLFYSCDFSLEAHKSIWLSICYVRNKFHLKIWMLEIKNIFSGDFLTTQLNFAWRSWINEAYMVNAMRSFVYLLFSYVWTQAQSFNEPTDRPPVTFELNWIFEGLMCQWCGYFWLYNRWSLFF